MLDFRKQIVLLLLAIHTHYIDCIMWDRLHCAPDPNQDMTEGSVADIERFPWLGMVQHAFYVGGKTHYAVTGAVLIHPAFAIAAAEDIAKIAPDQIVNNTHLIVWGKSSNKFVLDVKDYVLHPQYQERVTYATIALLDLIAWGESPMSEWQAPVLPVCMPVKGSGTFEQIYAVKMGDTYGKLEKEIIHMKYVENQACEEFYYKAQLSYTRMNPINPLCAVSKFAKAPCVWDAGTALITRQSWGYWRLLGFAVRGPGCGAPTRFLNIHDYLPWIHDIISRMPYQDSQDTWKLGIRRQLRNPYGLFIYKVGARIPKCYGKCEDGAKDRGTVLFKDSEEIEMNKNLVQGFYFLVITMMAEFSCAEVDLEVDRQTNAALWIEHNCHRDVMGLHVGHTRPSRERMACFMYFKTSAFIEIRFLFSFRAYLEITMYGKEEKKRIIPNPFKSTQYTTSWWPTEAPVLPVCMPVKGSGTFEQIYAVKMGDTYGKLEKEIIHMKYVENQACEEFYYKAQLSYTRMNPINPLCAVSKFAKAPCVWDAGTALITRQSWGYWRLLGFAVRGPGCGAPTRFLNIHDYLPWIHDIISRMPYQDSQDTWKLGIRRQLRNPYGLFIYKVGARIPKCYGKCEDGAKDRGTVLFKDSEEIEMNKNLVQGFYFLVITMMAEFSCAEVDLEVDRQTNAALWIEHNCHRDVMGLHVGHTRPSRERMACFMYFKTSAFIEIRFLFSFRAYLEITMYGKEEKKRIIPNPFKSTQYTTSWWPTEGRIKMGSFYPVNKWYWYI